MNGALVEGLSSRTRGRFSLHVHPPYKIPQTDLREIAARDHTGSVVDHPSNTVPAARFHPRKASVLEAAFYVTCRFLQ